MADAKPVITKRR